jgi:hypothetical protein
MATTHVGHFMPHNCAAAGQQTAAAHGLAAKDDEYLKVTCRQHDFDGRKA